LPNLTAHPKAATFINGILDAIVQEIKEENHIFKD